MGWNWAPKDVSGLMGWNWTPKDVSGVTSRFKGKPHHTSLVTQEHGRLPHHPKIFPRPRFVDGRWLLPCNLTSSCNSRIAWVHFPKCGTSFGNTLVHWANDSIPDAASIRDNESNFQQEYPLDTWFRHIFWEKGSTHKNIGNHYGISRQVYRQFYGHFFGMCTASS